MHWHNVIGANGNQRRHSWFVWREGKAPAFVLEVASPSTWRRDDDVKREIYAAMGVSEYWRFDATGHCFAIVPVRCPLRGRTGTEDGEYRRMPRSNDDGILRVHSEVLGLEFCVLPGLELRLYDPATGQWLPSHEESETARHAAETALRTEQEARQAAEYEVRMLRQRLRELEPGRYPPNQPNAASAPP